MPGDSINTLIESIRKVKDQINFIQVRHEEAGALAAAAYAKLTGKLGVCMGISGPGAIHLLNGLYDSKLDKAPVLAIVGQVETDLMGTDFFQEVDLANLFKDVAVYSQMVMSAEQLPAVLNQAIRTAYDKKGVSVLIIPDDIPRFEVERHARLTSSFYVQSNILPQEKDVKKAIKILNEAKRPVILAGKGVIPDEHPFCLGGLGLIGTKPATLAMEEADTLIMIGISFPFTGYLPKNAKTIQLDNDPSQIGKRYAVDVGLAGDSYQTLHNLITLVENLRDRSVFCLFFKILEKVYMG